MRLRHKLAAILGVVLLSGLMGFVLAMTWRYSTLKIRWDLAALEKRVEALEEVK